MARNFKPMNSKRKERNRRKKQEAKKAKILVHDSNLSESEEYWLRSLEQKVDFWHWEPSLKLRRSVRVKKIRVQPKRLIPENILISAIEAEFPEGCKVKPVFLAYKQRYTFDVFIFHPIPIIEMKIKILRAIEKHL